MTPSSCDLLVVAVARLAGAVVVFLVVTRGEVVLGGRLLEDFSEEDEEVQSDSFRPINQPSCFNPAIIVNS